MNLTRKQTGFTLIEVLLIVIIMSIITTSAYGGILNVQRTARVNSITRQFSAYLEIARSYAINGKLVDCASGQKCVPKSFGVIVQKDNPTCTDSAKRSINLFYQKISAQNFGQNDIVTLDSFCVDPSIEFWYAKTGTGDKKYADGVYFAYTPPFGAFVTTDQTVVPQPITLSFCEATSNANSSSSCDSKKTYTKVLTLYTNAGVLE